MNPAATLAALPARLSSKQRRIIALMFALSVMSYFDRTIMSIAGPGIMREFGLTETEMGSVYSAFLISYALLMIPGGWLADRVGARKALAWSAFGAALFTGLTALGGEPGLGALLGVLPSFLLVRLALGVVTAPLYPTCGKVNADWMGPQHRARVQAYVASGAGLGGAVSPILFAWMISRVGWRLSFVMAALATAAFGMAWWWFARYGEAQAPPPVKRPTPWKALLTNRDILLFTAGYFAVDYFEYIFFYWIYYYLGEVRGLGAADSAFYTTILFLGFLCMTPLGGWAADRLARRYGRMSGMRIVGVGGLLLGAILLVVGAAVHDTATAVICMALALGFASCSDVTFWAGIIETAGDDAGAAGGVLNMGGNVGGALAPVLTPMIAARFGWEAGLYFGSAMAMMGMLTWLLAGRTTAR